MNKDANYEIVSNAEKISYLDFITRLTEIHRDCNHEHYLSEVFIPFFQMCCSEKLKIVPIYDDRSCGPRTENQTKSKKRMHTICAPKGDDEYVVPDYIFVTKSYSFSNPIKPLLMVETKNPVFIKDETVYRKLSDFVVDNKSELLAEISSCKYVIFTDGITWMFLEERDGEIIESNKYPSITLVDFHQAYYKTNYVTQKEKRISVDLSILDLGLQQVIVEPDEWGKLKEQISAMLHELEEINQNIS